MEFAAANAGLFKASPQFIIDQQKLVVVLQEVNPTSAPELLDYPGARRTGKRGALASEGAKMI